MKQRMPIVIAAAAVILGWMLSPTGAQPAAPPAAVPPVAAPPAAAPPAAGSAGTVAVCDVVVVFNEYQRAKDLTLKLNERRDALRAENEKRGKAIDVLRTELEGLKSGSKEYEQRLNEVQRLTIERTAWLQFQETLIMRDHQRLTREMYEQILKMIQTVAEQNGFLIVLQRDKESLESQTTQELVQKIASRKVLYNHASVDITDPVLARLNDQYRLSGAATSGTTTPKP